MQRAPDSLRSLFEAALTLPPEARAAFLSARCADPELRARLQALLTADANADDSLGPASAAQLAGDIGEIDDELSMPPGARIGPFELLEVLGEGGSSTVFRARREFQGVTQLVALKLLHRNLHAPDAKRRFRAEHKALAQLQHPGIARLIEGGVTDDGLGFIALELIDGVPITEYARDHKLDLRARLRLIVQACAAVAASHRALIVHRDLKPANVLVTARGEVKLLDFGIAKLLDDNSATAIPAFTPAYAAPEQRHGGPISTATDVYALGVLLGELVTGKRLDGSSGHTPSGQIADTTAPGVLPASAPVTRRLLRGDLDTIVLKAIEAEPERRYDSASALAHDVTRALAGQPVTAHPPTRWYRTRKFVARHRGGVATTAAFVLAVVAALGLALWQAGVARSQAHRAAEIQVFLESLFAPLQQGTSPARAPTVHELLQRGLARADSSFSNDSRARAEILSMFARINDAIGEVEDNLALSESALDANLLAYGGGDPHTLDARTMYARVLRRLGRYQEALQQYEAAQETMRRRGVTGVVYARLLEGKAYALHRVGRAGDALRLKRQAVVLRENDPDATTDDLASGYNNLGIALDSAHDYPGALKYFGKAWAIHAEDKGDSVATATSLANMGNVYSWMGQWHEATEKLEQARAMYARVGLSSHPNLTALLIRLCDVRAQLEAANAQAICDQALAAVEAMYPPDHPYLAMALTRHAGAAVAAGNLAAASADFDRARAIFSRSESKRATWLSFVAAAEARVQYWRGDYPALRDGLLAFISRGSSAKSTAAPRSFAWFALACKRAPGAGCSADAISKARRVLADPLFKSHPDQLAAHMALAEIRLHRGDAHGAIAEIGSGMAIAAPELGDRHSMIAAAHLLLARAYAKLGDNPHARAELVAARTAIDALPAPHPLHARLAARAVPALPAADP